MAEKRRSLYVLYVELAQIMLQMNARALATAHSFP